MIDRELEMDAEEKRLKQTINLAELQLEEAEKRQEETKLEIIAAKQELRENTVHSISNLWGSDGFEALAELNQYANPVTDKIVDYDEREREILRLKSIIKSPYFARIDFRFEGEEEYENIYIGRSSLKKEKTYDMDVYDWRSPIAGIFYRFVLGPAFYDAPGGRITGDVSLKRQYEIKDGKLEYFLDADIQIVDEFLRKLLSQNTSDNMKAIVETIQREQDIIIRDMENDLMMVQGVAGSGKTSVALHRAAYLMYKGLSSKLSADNIIIISPNTLFEQYISHVLPELGEENVVSVILEDMMKKILGREQIQTRNQLLERIITDTNSKNIRKRSLEFKTSPQFIKMLSIFLEDIPYKWMALEDFYYREKCIVKKEVLVKKLTGRIETPLGVKLEQLEDYILEQISAVLQIHIHRSDEADVRREIQKMIRLPILELYKMVFEDREYFNHISKEVLLPEYIDDILTYTKENLSMQNLFYDDAVVLTYLELKINGARKYKNIKQVVIDEAQDYYPMHFEIFQLLFSSAKFTVLGDINQTLEKKEDLGFYDQISQILKKKKSSLVTMDKSFRCTNEILEYSSKFVDHDFIIKSFNRSGEIPKVYPAQTRNILKDNILSEIKVCREKDYRSIGLLTKSERNAAALFDLLKDELQVSLIKAESTEMLEGVFIIPIYLSKGLEFDAVLIGDADCKNYHSEEDKKLLYIACTRALHRLNLFCLGQTSLLIG